MIFFRTPPKPLPKVAPKPGKTATEETVDGIAPAFTIRPRNRDILEGMQIRLSCGANGKPDPEFTWFKDGNRIQSTDRIKINSTVGMTSLSIQEAEVDDGGIYKVVAKNRIAEISTEAEVLIEGKFPISLS